MKTAFLIIMLALLPGLGACASAPPGPQHPAELAVEYATRFPHHRLLAEHLYTLSAELRLGLEAGIPVDQIITHYLAGVPPQHRQLGALARRIEDGLSDPERDVFEEHVRPYIARAQGALISVLAEAREVEPEAVERGARLLLDWLKL